jgi:hypothetical protein
MKIHKKTSATKLLVRFDNELKAILVNDLNNIRNIKRQFLHSNHQARLQVS